MRRTSKRGGRFIVLEGLDGAGTTTQGERLAQRLRGLGRPVLFTRQPSDGPVGALLRQALTGRLGLPSNKGPLPAATLALLFAADRLDHLDAVVRPALADGRTVICDRYVLSSLAYQGSALPMEWIDVLNQQAQPADLTLFVDVDVPTAAKRRATRGGDPELFDDNDVQRRIRAQYRRALVLSGKRHRVVEVDGSGTVEGVSAAIWRRVAPLLGMPQAE